MLSAPCRRTATRRSHKPLNIMDDNNTTPTVCAGIHSCTPSVAASKIQELRKSKIWRFRESDQRSYKKTQTTCEQNAHFSALMQLYLQFTDKSLFLNQLFSGTGFNRNETRQRESSHTKDNLFKYGAVVSPNNTCQAIHPTRRLGEAINKTSRRIKNATNSIKQHSSRIS